MSSKSTIKDILFPVYLSVLVFLTYSSVYAFRKPFSVATFEGRQILGISYQTALVISQVIGYMISKFCGIRLISSLKRTGRMTSAILLVSGAWTTLLLFALLPDWAGIPCLLVNGFLLGFMWGVVFSYAEGRRATDFIGSVLAISFIFAGGFTRSVAKWLMTSHGITEKWMPFMTGLVFIFPYFILVYLLERVPPPDATDKSARMERHPMTKAERNQIMTEFMPGLVVLAASYTILTIMRDLRDNFMSNIWNELGYKDNFNIFTASETRISVGLLISMGLLVMVRKHIVAMQVIHLLVILGFAIAGVSSFLFSRGAMPGAIWMQLAGLGLYLAYIPFNAIYFDRMIATFRLQGNVGFLIYLTDAFGYLGSVVIMLLKEGMTIHLLWSSFYAQSVIIFSILGIMGTVWAGIYFSKKYKLKTWKIWDTKQH